MDDNFYVRFMIPLHITIFQPIHKSLPFNVVC